MRRHPKQNPSHRTNKFQFIELFHFCCHCEPVTDVTGVAISKTQVVAVDSHASGAPRSESIISMLAGGKHTAIKCGLARNDNWFVLIGKLHHKSEFDV